METPNLPGWSGNQEKCYYSVLEKILIQTFWIWKNTKLRKTSVSSQKVNTWYYNYAYNEVHWRTKILLWITACFMYNFFKFANNLTICMSTFKIVTLELHRPCIIELRAVHVRTVNVHECRQEWQFDPGKCHGLTPLHSASPPFPRNI